MKVPKAPFLVALLGVAAMAVMTTIVNALNGDSIIDSQESVQIAIQGVAAVNIYLTANLPGYENAKKYVMAVILVLQALYTFVIGGVDTTEWINLAITFLSALGVTFVPQPMTNVVRGEVVTYPANTTAPLDGLLDR